MAVAKTYAKLEISGDPFMENKRMYVNVVTTKGLKKVRWYSDAEYRRMYPDEVKENDKHNVMDFNARHVFGFGDSGWIILYKGNKDDIESFVDANHKAFRYNCTFGYYTPSRISTPVLPSGIIPVKLNWSEVMDHDDRMKPHEVVQKIVAEKLGMLTKSKYQGAVNEWLQKTVKVTKKTSKESHYGTKHTYDLEDSDGNTYVWETGAKDFACAQTVSLKMKVKEHKEIDGNEVTVVWYCKEV